MFEVGRDLRALILEHLPEEGLSISALSRKLEEKGVRVHRLELSGYLKALSDLSILRARDVKPSKIFSPVTRRRRDIYELLGEVVRQEVEDEDERATLALHTLCRLFRRPVFERELRLCGLIGTPNAVRAGEREREDARAVALRAGVRLSPADVALISGVDRSQDYGRVLAALLIEAANLRPLVSETRQRTLEEG